ncbi:zinc-dependent metalloprotease [Microlunatus phosphovorus]|nr:zinc-dependent metalloprotease [Microlunatus phosphovorus]
MSTSMVDWTVALSTASRLVKPGPEISREGAATAVADLRSYAVRAEEYVQQVTGLTVPRGTAPVLVVDRPRWIEANIEGFRQVLAPLSAKLAETKTSNAVLANLGARVTGVEVGALLSYLAPKVLGQFDPFYPELAVGTNSTGAADSDGNAGAAELPPGGRLLLVAPNIVAVERELELVPADFRLWVCLHEETHRVQFTAVPWLRGYLNSQIAEVVATAEVDASALASMLREAVKRIADAARGDSEVSIVDLVQTPEQREIIDRITAVMSLLEGHADVVMDGVGPEVIGTIAEIRRRFTVRSQGQGFDKIIRRLLGLDAKMRQYRDGAAFCKAVIAEVGMDGLNRVWTSPATLPTKDEIADPKLWLARMDSDGSNEAIEGRSNADEPGVTPAGPGVDPGGPDGSGV